MNIKKWNARLSLFTMALLLIHELYQLYAYISFYYNPVLSKAFGYAVASGFVLHGILSAVCIFALHDAKTVAYKKLNLSWKRFRWYFTFRCHAMLDYPSATPLSHSDGWRIRERSVPLTESYSFSG